MMVMEETRVPAGRRKRDPRHKVALAIRLKIGARWYDATILNASQRGFMIRVPQPADSGSQVEIRRGSDLWLSAKVIWNKGGRIGVRTQDVIDLPALLRHPMKGRVEGRTDYGMPSIPDKRRAMSITEREDRSRQMGSLMQYCMLGGAVVVAACMLASYVYQMLSTTTQMITAAL